MPSIEVDRSLYKRLLESLSPQSPPERKLFNIFFSLIRDEYGSKLPALIPQVYLHYDPYTIRELKQRSILSRQRMDFLLLFSNHERIVIEIDGKQHYSDENEKANPKKYAEMVAADRYLRLAGYEVYRFGGSEFQGDNAKTLIESFFRDLFKKHGTSAKG
jgi:very-short-patch-repair endonuclease